MTPPSHDAYRALRTFGSLDGLRGLAILAVLFHHVPERGGGALLGSRGFLGVDLFFVISGFLIVTLLLRESERRGRISLGSFYARRALRILPLYYGVLAVAALLFGVLLRHGSEGPKVRHDLPFCLTYVSNWVPMQSFLGITWSLSAEEQFYLLWPPLEKLVPRSLLPVLGFLAVTLSIQIGLLDAPMRAIFGAGPGEPPMLRESSFTPILLGVLVAHLLHSRSGYEAALRALSPRWVAPAVAGAIGVALVALPEDLRRGPRSLIQLLFALLVASAVVREDHGLRRVLSFPALARIGAVSYGMYLLHPFVLHLTEALVHRGVPPGLELPLLVAGSWAVAELSYRLYERRFLELKERYRGDSVRAAS